jgi:hypothetical protein
MKGMYIKRHNEAVWVILRSLLSGRLGASVVMHDAGHKDDGSVQDLLMQAAHGNQQQEDQADDGLPLAELSGVQQAQLGTRIPAWVYDTPLGPEQDRSKWDRFRPDILLVTEGSSCAGDRLAQFYKRTVHIVEVKYCRDTDPSAQSLRAEQQHEALRDALLQVGYKAEQVHLHIITLGATGTIYKDIHAMLQQLGLDSKTAVKRCCAGLHKHAALHVMQILKTKWAQEHAAQRRGIG